MLKKITTVLTTVLLSTLFASEFNGEIILRVNDHEHPMPDLLGGEFLNAYTENKSSIESEVEGTLITNSPINFNVWDIILADKPNKIEFKNDASDPNKINLKVIMNGNRVKLRSTGGSIRPEIKFDYELNVDAVREVDSLFAEAIQLLNDIITAAPDDPIVYAALNGIVSIFKRINNESGLLANLNALHEMYPDRLAGISAYDYSVTVYANMRDFDEALSRSEDVIAIYISQGAEEEPAWSILEQGLIYEYLAQSEYSMDRVTSIGLLRAKAEQAFGHVLHDYSQTEAAWFLRQLLGEDYAGGVSPIPQEFSLAPAFPNPFNPVTTLIYNLPEESRVELTIYNLLGREVIRLVDENKPSGRYSEIWNGRDKFGTQVSSGMYFCWLSAKSLEGRGEFHKSQKMVLLR